MQEFDIDKILLEANYKSKKGYIDIESIEDIKLLENVMYEMGYKSNFINSYIDNLIYNNINTILYKLKNSDLLNEGILDSIRKFISTSWQKLKLFINNSFKMASNVLQNDYTFEKEYIINIPSELTENYLYANKILLERNFPGGEITAKKGYYNEALVCQNIINYKNKNDEILVVISEKYLVYKNNIDNKVEKYKNEIKDENILREVENGSKAMANYILNLSRKNNTVIVGAFLSGTEKNAPDKRDITIVLQRAGLTQEEMKNYSLKLYTSKNINLSNTTPVSLIYSLTKKDNEEKDENEYVKLLNTEISKLYRTDEKFRKNFDDNKKIDNIMKKLKKLGKEKNKDKISFYRELRGKARVYINQIYANLTYKILNDFVNFSKSNEKLFVKNLLKLIGFNNTEVSTLIAIMDKKTLVVKELIDQHPEFDLSNINLKKKSISITINNGNDLIVQLNFKEGKSVAGMVSFKNVKPVDKSEYLQ